MIKEDTSMNIKVRLLSVPKTKITGFTSRHDYEKQNLRLNELSHDVFEKDDYLSNSSYDEDEIAPGPLGHISGRPIIPPKDSLAEISFLEWLFTSKEERKGFKTPGIVEFFSLGDNNFNDEVALYHSKIAQDAKETAIGLFQKGGNISIPIGDINKDGIADRIISGVNRAIDITGDNKADIIGTLIDIDGDGKADFILDQMGKMINLGGKTARVLDDTKININDIELIPKVVMTLFRGNK